MKKVMITICMAMAMGWVGAAHAQEMSTEQLGTLKAPRTVAAPKVAPAQALQPGAVQIFLKLDTIPGESTNAKHKDEIVVLGFLLGASQSGTASHGGGMGAGRVQLSDAEIIKAVDKASPKLFLACAQGTHIKSAVVTVLRASGEQSEIVKYTLSDLLVSTVTQGSDGPSPTERVTLNFTKIEISYTPISADGKPGGAVKSTYDMKQQISQ